MKIGSMRLKIISFFISMSRSLTIAPSYRSSSFFSVLYAFTTRIPEKIS